MTELDISAWVQSLHTKDPRVLNGVPVNGGEALADDYVIGSSGMNMDEAAFQDEKRRYEARERLQRELLETEFDGTLTPSQEAKATRIRGGMMTREQLEDLPRPVSIIRGLLYEDSLSWIAGASGSYKSFIALDVAARYASGDMTYHGLRMCHGKALIVVGEGNSSYLARVKAWEIYHRRPWPVDAVFHDGAIQIGDRDSVAALGKIAMDDGYGLVILDTQAMMTVGKDENGAMDMGIVTNAMHQLRQATKGCVLTVHHFGKDASSGMRGNSSIYAAATTVIVTTREGQQVTLSTVMKDGGKQKDASERKYDPFVVADVCVREPTAADIEDDPDDTGEWSLVVTAPVELGTAKPKVVVPVLVRKLSVPILRVLVDKDVFGGSPTQIIQWIAEETGQPPLHRGSVAREINCLVNEGLIKGPKTALKITDLAVAALADLASQGSDDHDNR